MSATTTTAPALPQDPYRRPVTDVVRDLGSDGRTGLSRAEAADRLARYGPNTLPAARGHGPVVRFLLQFHNPLIYVLLASALITALLGDHVDAWVILGVVIINAVVGFVQESKAERALASLAAMTETTTTVIREGTSLRLPASAVVPGDVVVLEAGEKVPADLRVLESEDLKIDESGLTGESEAVRKDPREVPAQTLLADRADMAYAATLVTYGRGTGITVATGAHTEFGAIQRLIGEATGVQTPLTRKIAHFTRVITVAILALAAGTFLIGLLRGEAVADTLTAAVALAVGAIPEGLPAVVTITMAFGVARMVKRNAIVRHLPAVETLGSTTVICTDKTGTLTKNQMTVTTIIAAGRTYAVTGTGYAPHGEITLDGRAVDLADDRALAECLAAGRAANDARITEKDPGPQWDVIGDPTEGALVTSAGKAGVGDPAPRVHSVPFESGRQFMATLHRAQDGHPGGIYVKGSVERVLDMCGNQMNADGSTRAVDREGILATAHDLGGRALRVLAFATAQVGPEVSRLADDDLPPLTFLGLQAMHDPPRPEAAAAVAACHGAGIQVKMITGDHAATAQAIGAALGLEGELMTGADLAECPDADLPEAAERTSVFARVSPEQKLRLVRALQSRGHVIAMTGDGVNDAPALKQADIGVAMGQTGTEVAKDAADMVLTDDNFASIEAAVEEGRGVFDNLVKFIVWALPANIGLGLVLVAAIVTGSELPILPVQVLWLNMTAVLVLGLPFAVEPIDPRIMQRPPREPNRPLITRSLMRRILLVSAVLLVGAFFLFGWERSAHDADLAVARTVVVNVFAMTLLAYTFNCLSLDRPMLWSGIRRNPWVGLSALALIGIQLLFTYVPIMNDLFESAPMDALMWLRVALVALVAYALVEAGKWLNVRSGHGHERFRHRAAGTPHERSGARTGR